MYTHMRVEYPLLELFITPKESSTCMWKSKSFCFKTRLMLSLTATRAAELTKLRRLNHSLLPPVTLTTATSPPLSPLIARESLCLLSTF